MSRFTVTALSLALLAGCAGMQPPPPPAAEPEAPMPAMTLRQAVQETMDAMAATRGPGSTVRACEVQAEYHVGAFDRAAVGQASAPTLGIMPESDAAGTVTMMLVDDRCAGRPRLR